MFKSPTSRRKSESEPVNPNLVPMLDALVTLVTFLLFSSAFLSIVVIDSPAPLIAPVEEQVEKINEKPLQLTAYIKTETIILSDWSGSRESHSIPSVIDPKTGEKRYDFEKFHQTLLGIKSRHPLETKIVFKPDGGVSYDVLISLMDAARSYEKSDSPLFKKNAQGIDEPETKLFPEIIFGNILS